MRKRFTAFPTRSDRNRVAQPQKIARGLKFRILKVEGLYYLCGENKGAGQLLVTAKLICGFVFAYARSWFSHNEAHILVIKVACLFIFIELSRLTIT